MTVGARGFNIRALAIIKRLPPRLPTLTRLRRCHPAVVADVILHLYHDGVILLDFPLHRRRYHRQCLFKVLKPTLFTFALLIKLHAITAWIPPRSSVRPSSSKYYWIGLTNDGDVNAVPHVMYGVNDIAAEIFREFFDYFSSTLGCSYPRLGCISAFQFYVLVSCIFLVLPLTS